MDEAAKSLDKLIAQMTTAQHEVFNQAAQRPARAPVRTFMVHRVKAAPPQLIPVSAEQKAQATSASDPIKATKDRILAQAYREAFGGPVPMDVLHAAFGDAVPGSVINALTRPPE